MLYRALREVGIEQYKLLYAGSCFSDVLQNAKASGAEGKIVNLGYLTRQETESVQKGADIFLVAAWNDTNEQGVLTGKFYEGIRAKKPIIAIISGNAPNSELRGLIESYRLGVCYESADHEKTYYSLKEYIRKQYNLKISGEMLAFNPKEEVFQKFSYAHIVKELDQHLRDLVAEKC